MKWLKLTILLILISVVYSYCTGPSKKDLEGCVISWDALPGISGYRVRVGPSKDNLTFKSKLIRGTTFYVANLGLKPGVYVAVITSESWAGVESFPSKPIEFTIY